MDGNYEKKEDNASAPSKKSFPKLPVSAARLMSLGMDPNHYGLSRKKTTSTISFVPSIPQGEKKLVSARPQAVISVPKRSTHSVNPSYSRHGLSSRFNSVINISSNSDIDSVRLQMPKKPKSKQYLKSEIAPTAHSMGIDPLNLNHPLTLPFIDAEKVKMAMGDPSKKSNNIEARLDPGKPADFLFKNDSNEYYGEDQIFFVQMPSHFPICAFNQQNVIVNNTPEYDEILGFKGNLDSIPSGKIGKLQIFKSGKVKLLMGDISLDVTTGMPCNFFQEFVSISSQDKKYYQLGEVSKRMVCYPDIDSVLPHDEALFEKSTTC